MRRVRVRRLTLCAGLAFCVCPLLIPRWCVGLVSAVPPRQAKLEQFTGKVVPLAGLVEKAGSTLDADAAPYWLALVAADGKVYPLVKDAGARMFFKDKTLLNRPMRLTGTLLPGSQVLQVVEVQSIHKVVLPD